MNIRKDSHKTLIRKEKIDKKLKVNGIAVGNCDSLHLCIDCLCEPIRGRVHQKLQMLYQTKILPQAIRPSSRVLPGKSTTMTAVLSAPYRSRGRRLLSPQPKNHHNGLGPNCTHTPVLHTVSLYLSIDFLLFQRKRRRLTRTEGEVGRGKASVEGESGLSRHSDAATLNLKYIMWISALWVHYNCISNAVQSPHMCSDPWLNRIFCATESLLYIIFCLSYTQSTLYC